MSLQGLVVVKDELDRFDAENVAAFLRAQGIEAMVNSDDAGGTIPSLEESLGAQVLVSEENVEKARELIAAQEAAAPSENADS